MNTRAVRGQALAEAVLLIPVLVMVVFTLLWFMQLLVTRQQLVLAARYGTDMICSTTLNETEIRREIRNYLSHRWISGRKLDAGRLTNDRIRITLRDFELPGISSRDLFTLPRLGEITRGLLDPLSETSSVEISYDIAVPRWISFLSATDAFTVRGRSEVLAGTGCRSRHHQRNPIH